nr:MAG TPA: anaerobic ribonucleoside triphosphate reductase [Caudoviricetes sp.]
MIRLDKRHIEDKVGFIKDYIQAENAATASKYDQNANVSTRNIATLSAELYKDYTIQINRHLVYDKLLKMYGQEVADKFLDQLKKHEIYVNDETSLMPYCCAISLYPFLMNGLKDLGGETARPQHLSSFNGGFVNLVFAVASQFAGAVATVGWLMCFDYFARKDYGDNYLETHSRVIEQEIQSVVYALNQPAAARGFQSVFWNISIYDRPYFEGMYGNFVYPDFSKPNYDSVNKLQKYFMKWFNKERSKAILTFPVVTAACLNDGSDMVDEDFKDFIAEELSESNSFFIFTDSSVNALSSCCRLKNDISDVKNDFSYSLGAGGESTGSKKVITINYNRMVQNKTKLADQVSLVHKYLHAYNEVFREYLDANMLPVFKAGFVDFNKLYLTIGLNGVLEAAEFLGFEISNNPEYINWLSEQFKEIAELNREFDKHNNLKINTECVPGENLGIKFANWDKKDGYIVPRDCYNSYFYKVEDQDLSIIDKFYLMGKDTCGSLDGGSALHANLEEYPTKEGFKKLLTVSVKTGCPYFCFNIKITVCNDCGNIDKHTLQKCPKCNSTNIDYATRIIGYLKKISSFSAGRKIEAAKRHYNKC